MAPCLIGRWLAAFARSNLLENHDDAGLDVQQKMRLFAKFEEGYNQMDHRDDKRVLIEVDVGFISDMQVVGIHTPFV